MVEDCMYCGTECKGLRVTCSVCKDLNDKSETFCDEKIGVDINTLFHQKNNTLISVKDFITIRDKILFKINKIIKKDKRITNFRNMEEVKKLKKKWL